VIASAEARGWARRAAIALLLAAGCDSGADRPDKSPPPPPPRPAAEAASATAALPPSAAPSAPPAASQAAASLDGGPAADSSAFIGNWQGGYDARKGVVELPPKVKDKVRGGDDGKAMAGAGKVELTISADGDVRGKASGALGDATLTGKIDEGAAALRASWFPDDPGSPNAMTGVLIGLLKGDVIAAEIRVAGPDAMLVREAKIELKRK
jgi:hypothetical protein